MSIERRVTRGGQVRWVARIKHKGALVDSKTFQLKADAEAWEREQKRALAFGQFIPSTQSALPFKVVVERFLQGRKSQVTPHTWRTDRDNLANAPAAWPARLARSRSARFSNT